MLRRVILIFILFLLISFITLRAEQTTLFTGKVILLHLR
jgi:hypothetical protein